MSSHTSTTAPTQGQDHTLSTDSNSVSPAGPPAMTDAVPQPSSTETDGKTQTDLAGAWDGGLDGEDIKIVMAQTQCDRDIAIHALRQHGNLIDAILHIQMEPYV